MLGRMRDETGAPNGRMRLLALLVVVGLVVFTGAFSVGPLLHLLLSLLP